MFNGTFSEHLMEYTGAGIIATYKIKYDGAEIADYHNNHAVVGRDGTIDALLPDKICPCSLARRDKGTCLRPEIIEMIARKLNIQPTGSRTHEDRIHTLLHAVMTQTKCSDEKCVLDKAREMNVLSLADAGIEEQLAFKQQGPTDVSLFNDTVIQAQLYAWMYQFPDFWAYNFNMLNYSEARMRYGKVEREPDTLATTSWIDLYNGRLPEPVGMKMTPAAQKLLAFKAAHGIRRSACVINSDTYDGNGKHWMALFVDASAPIGSGRPWTIEFFNSAAVRPESEWLEWLAKTKIELTTVAKALSAQGTSPGVQSASPPSVEIKCVCKVWHQHSKSECGPYSLFYVWSRLNGIPPQYFLENVVPDQIMFEFRQHLFNNSSTGTEFNFARFAQNTKIRWDAEDAVKGKSNSGR